MGTIGDFVIDSVIYENGKIFGFAVYPLYGENNFKSIRMIMKGHSLNVFRTEAEDLYLHNINETKSEFSKIVIETIDKDGFPKIQGIDGEILQILKNLPKFEQLPGDAT